MSFDRNSAFSIEIIDPEEPGEQVKLIQTLTLQGELILFSTKAIFRALTADTLDPDKQALDTRHSYEKLYSVGASHGCVARLILQFSEMIRLIIRDKNFVDTIIDHVWNANRLLLECEKSHHYIYQKTLELVPLCDRIIEDNKHGRTIPAIPKIPDLNTHVRDFFMNGKLFLIEAYRLLNFFFDMPFNGANAAHFNRHNEWIKHKFGEQHHLYQLLKSDEEWVRMISECSNAVRHPEPGQNIEVENISLKAGNKFSDPGWKYDLTKKELGKQDHFTSIVYDFEVRFHNMLTFFEELLLLCLKEKLNDQKMFDIFKKKIEDVNSECPTLYFVGLKAQPKS